MEEKMEKIIIYGSKYGFTKSYAIELAKRTKVEAISYKEISSLENYETIVYFGGLYASNVLGLSKTLKKYPIKDNQKLVIVTVGIGDPRLDSIVDEIKVALKKQLPQDLFDNCDVYNLQGGLSINKLNFFERLIMKIIYNHAKKEPQNDRFVEIKKVFESENQELSFVNFDNLKPIEAVFSSKKTE
jgi:menaquinone-dependent protoporphyrinogen IX oxidase